MKTLKKRTKATTLIKPDLKIADLTNFTRSFTERSSLAQKKKTELAMRINNFVFYMQGIILSYIEQNAKPAKDADNSMQKQFKEHIRRIKISFAHNPTYYRQCVEYWKEVADILRADALILGDNPLLKNAEFFKEQLELIRF